MLNKCYTRAQGPLSLSLTLGHTGEAIAVWEEGRRGRREGGGAWIREKGGETDSNRERISSQGPGTSSPAKHRDSGSP